VSEKSSCEFGKKLFDSERKANTHSCRGITSNLGFADWTRVFGDQSMTAALLDRSPTRPRLLTATGRVTA